MTNRGQIVVNRLDNIVYGVPAADAIAQVVERLGHQRVFLMASGTLSRKTDEISKITDALGSRLVNCFSSMPAHTPRGAVIDAVQQAKEARADVVLTVGGGSVTDAGKAVQLCLANQITTVDGLDALLSIAGAKRSSVSSKCVAPTVRQIAVPTTLSGGEYGAVAGVTNENTKTKELFRHPDIAPAVVILDPEIAQHTPEWLWLSTGVRAIDHCVEGISSLQSNMYSDTHAIRGLSLLTKGLMAVKNDPTDLQARLDCQLGAWLAMGTTASGVPMGASHGIGYALGALFGVPHGHTSCVMLPSVMRWNEDANADRQRIVAEAMGKKNHNAADVLFEFIAGLEMPTTLSAVNVKVDQFETIAAQSMSTPWIPHNPRSITTASQVLEILDLAK